MKRSFKNIEDKIRKINIYLKGVPEKEARSGSIQKDNGWEFSKTNNIQTWSYQFKKQHLPSKTNKNTSTEIDQSDSAEH